MRPPHSPDATSTPPAPRVAVIGSGVAGLVAAYVMAPAAQVTLLEADDRLGGHADTHLVHEGERTLAIDTGYIVHNRRTYPILTRIFGELGVRTRPSEMSLSVSSVASVGSEAAGGQRRLEWAGAIGPKGLFPTAANLTNLPYLRMLTEIPRFHRMARALLAQPEHASGAAPEETLGEFLHRGGFSDYFRRHFAAPVVAAVWSSDPDTALDYPARYLFTFLQHHGMLRVFGSPEWRTMEGGSAGYVARIAERLDEVRTGARITRVTETGEGVEVTDQYGRTDLFDQVVIATHPHHSLDLLDNPSPAQREVLGAIGYSTNPAVLHTDPAVMPTAPRAWACWNQRERPGSGAVTVTYDLTRLMRLDTDVHYFVTLGGEDLIDPSRVIDRMDYEHPQYTPASVAAARRMDELHTARVAFAGAWQGWGFHEDGARSGVAAVQRLGFDWAPGPEPGLYRTRIAHTRRTPWRHHFDYRSWAWLVDLDDLPDHGIRGRFEARDHLGDPAASIKDNVIAFAATRGIDVSGTRILMAACARAFGYCFNPISVFWCLDPDGTSVATILEVHNTYGDRHAYLVQADAKGYARVDKAMYVSPFHGVDGYYEIYAPVPSDRLRVAIRLTTADPQARPFTASLLGERVDGDAEPGPAPVLRSAPAAAVGSLRIRQQGIGLWLKKLPVQPRPRHQRQEGV